MGNDTDQDDEEEDQTDKGRDGSKINASLQSDDQGIPGNLIRSNCPINNVTISEGNYVENDYELGSDDQNKKTMSGEL